MTQTLADRVGALEDSTPAVDPSVPKTIQVNNPAPAAPTDGPHRVTIHVPEYDTTFSLGQAADIWGTSAGIVGKTGPNVYFEATAEPHTAVSMGEGGKGSGYVDVGVTGYKMKTDGNAFRHADKQLYVTSTGGDVIANTMSGCAVLQSDGGTVEINAGSDVAFQAAGDVYLTAQAHTPAGANYATAYGNQKLAPGLDGEVQHGWADILQSAGDLALSCMPRQTGLTMTVGRTGGFKPPGALATAASVANIAGSAWSVAGGSFLQATKVYATNNISMGGGVSASIGGTMTASITGGFSSAIFATVATVATTGFAAAWGGGWSTLEGTKKSSVIAQSGSVSFTSMMDTSVSGKYVQLVASSEAQLNADSPMGTATIYSGSTAFVGAASTFGLVANDSCVYFGNVGNAKAFDGAKVDQFPSVKITGTEIVAACSDASKLTVEEFSMMLECDGSFLRFGPMGLGAKGKGLVELKPT